MGLDFSYDLYYNANDMEAALRATAAITPKQGRLGELLLPSGQRVSLPVWTRDDHNSVSISKGETLFKTQLLVPMDEDVSHFLDSHRGSQGREEHDGQFFARLGFIYVSVNLGDKYVEITFGAPSTWMSLLFQESVAIRQLFCRVLETSGGLAGVLNLQGDRMYSLLSPGSPEIQDLLPDENWIWDDDDVLNIDLFAQGLLQAVKKAEVPLISGR